MTKKEPKNSAAELLEHRGLRRRALLKQMGAATGIAAVAGWAADRLFFRRAMNVNAAMKSVGVLTFQSTQPNDARNH